MSLAAAPAFAITADFTGFLQSRGIAYDNMDGNDNLDDNARGVDSRYRLWTNTALNENVKAVFAIEVDYTWGQVNPAAGTGTVGREVGQIGADAKGQIEIKQIYLDFNIPTLNTNVKAGTQYTVLGNGYILAGDDTTGVNVRYTPVKGQSFLLSWVKTGEGDKFSDAQDADYYHLQYDGAFAGWNVSPLIGYYDQANEGDAFFVGASTAGKVGPVALAATLIYSDWDNGQTGAAAADGNGIAALVNGKYVMDATTLSAEVGYAGDDENAGGAFFGVRPYHQFSEIITGGRFDGRGTIGSNQTVTAGATAAPYTPNWMYLKLGAEQKLSDALKASAFYVYAEQAEDVGATPSITYGHELDAYLDYTVVKGLTATVGGGYLLADDDFGQGDDAWKVGTALTYTF
jgi:hypothetical protein